MCCRPRVSIDEAVASGRKSTYREQTRLAFGLESGEGPPRAEPAEEANSQLAFVWESSSRFGGDIDGVIDETTAILFKLKKK